MKKRIIIKVLRPTGEQLKDWSDFASFTGFMKEINSGLGPCVLELGVPFDYQGNELEVGNIVEIYITDQDTLIDGSLKIYSGYISMFEPYIDGGREGITVNLLGHYTKMSVDILKNGNQTTLYSDTTNGLTTTASGSSADIGLILRAIINRYRAETVNPRIFYTLASIPLMSQTVLYAVSLKTYREAFDRIISMYAAYSFWYIDENGMVSVKSKPSTPTHTFSIGTHIKILRIQKSLEKTRNSIIIWNGEPTGSADLVFKNYKDDASILQFGRRNGDPIIDTGIGDSSTADKIGANYIGQNKDPDITVTCEIADNNMDPINGYDIDSIQPGDTCRFIGYNPTAANFLNDNMLITKVDYSPDKVILTIQIVKSDIINWQDKTAKEVNDLRSQGAPASYT